MTFIIRRMRRRPNGQLLVRDTRVERATLTIGRATNNDVFLPDLQVALNHVTATLSGTRLNVAAVGDKSFLVDNRAINQLTIADQRPRKIDIGPYAIEFSRGEGADIGTFVVEVKRTQPEEKLQPDEVDKMFTLRGTPLRKRTPAWVFFASILAAFLVMPLAFVAGALPGEVTQTVDVDRPWMSGELSGAHANLEASCESCHKKAFEHVTTTTCRECHDDQQDHAPADRLATALGPAEGFKGFLVSTAAQFGKERGECADCHREHNGENGIIMRASSLCTDCHQQMGDRLADTTVGSASNFATDHPNFRPTLIKSPGAPPALHRLSLGDPATADNSGLKFPHTLHLAADGGVAAQAQALGADFGFGDALTCENCHEADKGGLLYEQVTMEGNCQMCHSLVFDTDAGVDRKLPHGQPAEVVATLREYYRSRAYGAPVETRNLQQGSRRRPGETAAPSGLTTASAAPAYRVPDNAADAMIARVFAPGGACFDCHEVVPAPAGTVDYSIVPVNLVDQFYTHARFDHSRHAVGELTCESCHDARGSTLASDVLLPGIEQRPARLAGEVVVGCRDCHAGEDAAGDMVPSPCADCHGFHEVARPAIAPTPAGKRAEFLPATWQPVSAPAALR